MILTTKFQYWMLSCASLIQFTLLINYSPEIHSILFSYPYLNLPSNLFSYDFTPNILMRFSFVLFCIITVAMLS